MRIIGGEARGRRLFAPAGQDTRPTSDRTRESLFNILAALVPGARVLDLFGGTGALALEAISRGAHSAVICDVSPAAVKIIRRNVECVLPENANARARVICADYRRAIGALAGQTFTLAFLDPPYRMTDVYADAVARMRAAGLLAPGAVVVMERAKDAPVSLEGGARIYDTRIYRDTAVDFLRWEDGT